MNPLIRNAISAASAEHDVSRSDILGYDRTAHIVAARHYAWRRAVAAGALRSEVAAAFGRHWTTVHHAVRGGRDSRAITWQTPKGDFIGAKRVAAAHGVHPASVYRHVAKYGHLDSLGTQGQARIGNCNRGIRVAIGGREFRSLTDLAAAAHMSVHAIRRRLKSGATDDIIAALMAADARAAA